MMPTRLYYHPDGEGSITRVPNGLICTNEDEDTTAHIVIGPICVIELGQQLIALGKAEQAASQRNSIGATPRYLSEDLAERAGSVIGDRLLNALMRATSQAEAGRLIREAILDLHHPAAVAGFVVMVTDVMMIGMRNLPQFDDEGGDE